MSLSLLGQSQGRRQRAEAHQSINARPSARGNLPWLRHPCGARRRTPALRLSFARVHPCTMRLSRFQSYGCSFSVIAIIVTGGACWWERSKLTDQLGSTGATTLANGTLHSTLPYSVYGDKRSTSGETPLHRPAFAYRNARPVLLRGQVI